MATVLQILALNLVSVTFAIIAGTLCFKQRDGWGWFLFAALITFAGRAVISATGAA